MGIWTLYLPRVWYYPDRPLPRQGDIGRISAFRLHPIKILPEKKDKKRDDRMKKETTDEQTDMTEKDKKWNICEWQICCPRNRKIDRWAYRQIQAVSRFANAGTPSIKNDKAHKLYGVEHVDSCIYLN
jgi:hypothetical protein